jgi:hypothetical protein
MATTASHSRSRATITRRVRAHMPLWAIVVCSRLLVLAAGAAGALFTHRVRFWELFDPHRLSTSLGSLGNVLAAPALRWDGIWYVTIAEHGYRRPGLTPFFPLYPLLMRVLAWVVRSYVLAGVLVSVASFAIALALLHRLTKQELGARVADTTVLLLAFAPLSLFFTAVYTESLFLALLVGTFYLAREQRFVLASLTAAAAALTHIEGVLLVAPLALMYWRSQGGTFMLRRLWSGSMVSLAMPPVALAGFCVYLHTEGYGWLAPVTNANSTGYSRTLVGTPVMIWRALDAGLTGLSQTFHGYRPLAPEVADPFRFGFQNLIYLVVLVIALAALIAAWRRLPREYAVLAILMLVVTTSSAVAGRPLQSFDRYLLPIFPLWMAAAAWLQEHRLSRPVLQISSLLLVFYTVMFARWIFIA